MSVEDLNDDNFEATIAGSGLAIVDFHAPWCGPCIMFKPKFKRISKDYEGMAFFTLDGEANPAARATVQIDNLPYFGVYRDGAFIEGFSTTKEEVFRETVERHLGANG